MSLCQKWFVQQISTGSQTTAWAYKHSSTQENVGKTFNSEYISIDIIFMKMCFFQSMTFIQKARYTLENKTAAGFILSLFKDLFSDNLAF